MVVAAIVGANRPGAPRSARACRDAIEAIRAGLDEERIETLPGVEKIDLILGLWNHSPIRKSCAELAGRRDIDPERASSVIVEGVRELVHAARDSEEPQCCGFRL